MKIPSYARRTALFTDSLKEGNISLRIANVTLADTGRYRCYVPKLGCHSIVKLVVEPRSAKALTTETPLHPKILQTPGPNDDTGVEGGRLYLSVPILGVFGCIVLILGFGLSAYLLKLRHQPQARPPLRSKIWPQRGYFRVWGIACCRVNGAFTSAE
ncbi:hypothetical protein EPR50_G00194320 [Perca flavescens]|uniref:Immunoglobulin V-set domain-containing protein n=1 Tax=Perca flavescens TaxID=8167 RepID=A0A484CCE3_PERFV|nr:hypothetical protein EPR50_G00194320 [Perca flavescens]